MIIKVNLIIMTVTMNVFRFFWKQRNKLLWYNILDDLVVQTQDAYFSKKQKLLKENKKPCSAFHENKKISARKYEYIQLSIISLIFFCFSITFVCIFSPSLNPTPAKPTSLPRLHPPPCFCPCILYSMSCNALASLSPPHSPLPIVTLFLTSMSLVIFC